MSQKRFTSDKYEARQAIQSCNSIVQIGGEDTSTLINKFLTEASVKNPQYKPLKIPRRPKWNKKMTKQEINQQENLAFLEWRRDLAAIEEGNVTLAITPFEKNIEVWRQLWRVIEKSDLLLQIVDARNPYFFYSEDLEKYIQEVNESLDAQNDDGDSDDGSDKDEDEDEDDDDSADDSADSDGDGGKDKKDKEEKAKPR